MLEKEDVLNLASMHKTAFSSLPLKYSRVNIPVRASPYQSIARLRLPTHWLSVAMGQQYVLTRSFVKAAL